MANFAALIVDAGGVRQVKTGDVLTAPSFNAGKEAAPSDVLFANEYIHVGYSEFASGSYRLIGFGYYGQYSPAYIGFQEMNAGGNTYGDLVFATRATIAGDTPPTERMRITSAGNVVCTGDVFGVSFMFQGDPDTGIASKGANQFGIIVGGTTIATITTTVVGLAQPIQEADGSVSAPAYTFTSDPDTGMYLNAVGVLAFAVGGAISLGLSTTALTAYKPILGYDAASVNNVSYGFIGDPDTGMYRSSSNVFYLVAGAVPVLKIQDNLLQTYKPICALDGTVASPAYSFSGDYDTGFYALASYAGIGVAYGGVNIFNIIAGGIGIGTAEIGTSGTNVLALAEGVAPTTSPTAVAQIYAKDYPYWGNAIFARTQDGFQHENLLTVFPRREMFVYANAGAATITGVGMATAPVLTTSGTGSITYTETAYGPLINFNTGTTQDSGSGLTGGVGSAYTLLRLMWDFDISFLIQSDTSLATNARSWVGVFSGTGYESDSTPSLHYVAFRMAADVDGTAYWRCVTDNGSGTPTVTITTASVNNSYRVFRIVSDRVAGTIKFYISGTLVATHTATLPTSTQELGVVVWVTTLDTTSRKIRFNKLKIIHN